MEEKFGRLLFIVAFCQFHTYTCDLLALKSELDALAKCYEETTPSLFHTFVPNTTTTKKKKKKHFVYWVTKKHLLFGLKPLLPL